MPRKLIIDTDPGCDDAIAILLALASPEVEVLGLSTVMGNTNIAQVTENALKVLALAGRPDLPVYQGCAQPLLVPLDSAEIVHGWDGMAELGLPGPARAAEPAHAADWICDTVMAEPPGTISLCALGPLTNLALAIAKERRVATRLAEVVIMGGSFHAGGNSNRFLAAESNMANDPHAARIVFESGANITLAPLDLTHATLATAARIAAIDAMDTSLCVIVARIMRFYVRYDMEKMGLPGGPIHDPCAMAWLIAPELFETKRIFVEIETGSPRTIGMTLGDWHGMGSSPPNATVLTRLDSDGFYNLLTDRLKSL